MSLITPQFPGLIDTRRRPIPMPKNPLDVCTIVSVYPRIIEERKHTIQPGYFKIDKGTYENPSLLVVTSASWWREIDEEQPLLEIPNSSIQVAESVIKDYCNGLLACDMNVSMPGLFYVPGERTIDIVRKEFKPLLDKAKVTQTNWYQALIKLADGLWARTNGNPLVIGDDMRLAAEQLGVTNKDWMSDFQVADNVRCTACGSFRNPNYPVCPVCKAVVDVDKATKLGLKFAQ